ncbi:cupin-like domain-containing protein [Noviherbaspirillum galbum]|uniref:Cupin-like domain-containing protein n=1 Tax=Noviherbaspirillum galbum TaxID=2709383 RepID=A0A6B3ST88_9BURK|nr:cupin-like domain-containing protein [Noviherbaspirillum galbum]NEX63708.1 cupin-like domain-containing protein [Noviherbaspirillum galbum]
MSRAKNSVVHNQEQSQARVSPRLLPPVPALISRSPEDAIAEKQRREQKDALVRGVTSIQEVREAIRRVGRNIPAISAVPRISMLDAATFRTRAVEGLPFVITGLVSRWPLSALTPQMLHDRYGDLRVRARVGDYVNKAFAPDRAMQDMSMIEYLDLVSTGTQDLPPYIGNLELRELNRMCYWPAYFGKMGPPRFWLGPSGTVTPLHCDYDDNIFAQIWGTKRIFLSPPHHDEFLYTSEANAVLFGSPVNPEAPDFEKFPLARQASMIECIVNPGELLYLPAGWYHHVRSLTFSLSANRWARALPLALNGDPSLQRMRLSD